LGDQACGSSSSLPEGAGADGPARRVRLWLPAQWLGMPSCAVRMQASCAALGHARKHVPEQALLRVASTARRQGRGPQRACCPGIDAACACAPAQEHQRKRSSASAATSASTRRPGGRARRRRRRPSHRWARPAAAVRPRTPPDTCVWAARACRPVRGSFVMLVRDAAARGLLPGAASARARAPRMHDAARPRRAQADSLTGLGHCKLGRGPRRHTQLHGTLHCEQAASMRGAGLSAPAGAAGECDRARRPRPPPSLQRAGAERERRRSGARRARSAPAPPRHGASQYRQRPPGSAGAPQAAHAPAPPPRSSRCSSPRSPSPGCSSWSPESAGASRWS